MAMEPIEVTARFDPQGKIIPISFVWQGITYPVASTGRRWEDGDSLHILVMTPNDQVYELVYVRAVSRWYMGSFTPHRRLA